MAENQPQNNQQNEQSTQQHTAQTAEANQPAAESTQTQSSPASLQEGRQGNKVGESEVEGKATEETSEEATEKVDHQGNPINEDGTLRLEQVRSIEEITDEDLTNPTRNVELPQLPQQVADAIGTGGKPVVIKKNIFEKNKGSHKDLKPAQSRDILKDALYSPTLYGQNQKAIRPYNWILIHRSGKSSSIVLEVNENKDNVEVVNWHYLDEESFERKKRQAVKEGGQILTLESAAANAQTILSSDDKVSNSNDNDQKKEGKSATQRPKAITDYRNLKNWQEQKHVAQTTTDQDLIDYLVASTSVSEPMWVMENPNASEKAVNAFVDRWKSGVLLATNEEVLTALEKGNHLTPELSDRLFPILRSDKSTTPLRRFAGTPLSVDTENRLYDYAQQNHDGFILDEMARNPSVSKGMLQTLAWAGRDYEVAKNPSAPVNLLYEFAKKEDNRYSFPELLRKGVAQNPAAPLDLLLNIAKTADRKKEAEAHSYAAKNPSLKGEDLEKMAAVAWGVEDNPNVTEAQLKAWANGKHEATNKGLAYLADYKLRKIERAKREEERKRQIREGMERERREYEERKRTLSVDVDYQNALKPDTPADVLLDIVKRREDLREELYPELAKNPATPAEVLRLILTDKSADVFKVRDVAARNPSAPEDLLRSLPYNEKGELLPISTSIAENPSAPEDLLRQLAETSVQQGRESVRTSIAQNPSAPADLLRELSFEEDNKGKVKPTDAAYWAAQNPATPIDLLMDILKKANAKEHGDVQNAIARNPKVTGDNLEKAAQRSGDAALNPSATTEQLKAWAEGKYPKKRALIFHANEELEARKKGYTVRASRMEKASSPSVSPEQAKVRDGLVRVMQKAGLSVSVSEEEGQRVLDLARGVEREAKAREEQNTLESVNDAFNEQLAAQQAGTQEKGHVYELGMPNGFLRGAGIENLPMQLVAKRLAEKASKQYKSNHPFSLSDVKDLPKALAHPIAVFQSHTRSDSKVVLTEMEDSKGHNFVVVLSVTESKQKNNLVVEVNDVRSLYPKDHEQGIVAWINHGTLLAVDKEKAATWIDKRRSYSAEVANTNNSFDDAAKVVQNFQNPKLSEENLREQRVFHGTSHDFDHFDHSKMGPRSGVFSLRRIRKPIQAHINTLNIYNSKRYIYETTTQNSTFPHLRAH